MRDVVVGVVLLLAGCSSTPAAERTVTVTATPSSSTPAGAVRDDVYLAAMREHLGAGPSDDLLLELRDVTCSGLVGADEVRAAQVREEYLAGLTAYPQPARLGAWATVMVSCPAT